MSTYSYRLRRSHVAPDGTSTVNTIPCLSEEEARRYFRESLEVRPLAPGEEILVDRTDDAGETETILRQIYPRPS